MGTTWKEVWEGRRLDPAHGSPLARLMAADGLDTGFGSVEEQAWRQFVHRTAATIGITAGSTVYDVGCGAGAYLYELYQQGCEVAGLDASSALICYAQEIMPNGRWEIADAAELNESERYDFVVACGVFLYFPSLEYAKDVLRLMVLKARRGVMVLDVPDLSKQEQALRFRRQVTGEEAYAKKYANLTHLYYDKAWFEKTLVALGVNRMRIEDQQVEGYANSAFRYNIFGWARRD
jgi:trans-aconitate methyltransferase